MSVGLEHADDLLADLAQALDAARDQRLRAAARRRPASEGWRARWFHVIFGHQSAAGRRFDIAADLADPGQRRRGPARQRARRARATHARLLRGRVDLHAVFTAEYIVRLLVVKQPLRYARSFYGVIDLLAVLPTWLSLFFPGAQYLLVVRILRILRIFRVLKLTRYVSEAGLLMARAAAQRPQDLRVPVRHPDRGDHLRRADVRGRRARSTASPRSRPASTGPSSPWPRWALATSRRSRRWAASWPRC